MGLAAVKKAPSFEGVSPALRAILGFLSEQRAFTVKPWDFTGRFDNGEERVINAYRVHRETDDESDDRWIADVEGDVTVFTTGNAEAICPSSSGYDIAMSAFRKAAPLRWFLVI